MTGSKLLTGKLRQTICTDQVAVAGPVFFAQGDFPAAHRAVQGSLSMFEGVKTVQNQGLLKK